MSFDFTPDELIFIYRHFKSELRKAKPLKNNLPSAVKGLDRKMLESVVEKLEYSHPALKALER